MIIIEFQGLDQFVVGHYSKAHSENLANLFEVDEDELNFYAPNSMFFHKGVEQTSWHSLIIVRAPHKYEAIEDKVAKYLLDTVGDFSINFEVLFQYYDEEHLYKKTNDAYPLYMDSNNIHEEIDEEYHLGDDPIHDMEDEEDDEEYHEHHHHHESEEIFLGNAFEGVEERLDEIYKEDKDD